MYSHHGFPEVVGSRTYLQTLARVSVCELNTVQLNLTFMLSAVVVAIFIIIICLLVLCK